MLIKVTLVSIALAIVGLVAGHVIGADGAAEKGCCGMSKTAGQADKAGGCPMMGKQEAGESCPMAGKATTQPTTAPSVYTCPMHPDVVSKQPGECPKCGMKLVPKKETKPAGKGDGGAGHSGHQH